MPNDIWAIIMLISLVGWISSTLVFIFKAFPQRGVFNVKPAKTWGCVVLVFYGIWVLGMFMA
jgi:hypothetical protein